MTISNIVVRPIDMLIQEFYTIFCIKSQTTIFHDMYVLYLDQFVDHWNSHGVNDFLGVTPMVDPTLVIGGCMVFMGNDFS